jgi:hypothetical protein
LDHIDNHLDSGTAYPLSNGIVDSRDALVGPYR